MQRLLTLILWIGLFFQATAAHAGGGGGGGGPTFEWKDSPLMSEATRFAEAVASGDYAGAYEMGGEVLREKRTLEVFTSDMKRWGFDKPGSVEWTKGNNALPANNGFKIMGTYTATDGESFPVILEGDAHVDPRAKGLVRRGGRSWTCRGHVQAHTAARRRWTGSSQSAASGS